MKSFRCWMVPVVILLNTGCSMTAPVFVWQPPMNQSRTIQSIALAPIHGPKEIAAKLDEAMIESQPKTGNSITLLHPKQLEELTAIQLASHDGQPSDIAGLSAARRAGADVLVQGQIVRAQLDPQEPKRDDLIFANVPRNNSIFHGLLPMFPPANALKAKSLPSIELNPRCSTQT